MSEFYLRIKYFLAAVTRRVRLREFEEMDETEYLLRSPANAKRLLEAMERAKKFNER